VNRIILVTVVHHWSFALTTFDSVESVVIVFGFVQL